MKFDVVIGNPPYQGDLVGAKTSPPPIYHLFMDEAFNIGEKVSLVTPGRFLFNTGRTPKKWNQKMLYNEHFKVVSYEPDSSKYFENTDIMGGIVITYYDKNKKFDPIGIFTAFSELNNILNKVTGVTTGTLDKIIYSQAVYKFTDTMHQEKPETLEILSKGNEDAVGTGVLKSLNDIIFFENKPIDSDEYIKIEGLLNGQRVFRWIKKNYINSPNNLEQWKVLVPQANGSGALGEYESTVLIGQPQIAPPLVGHTQTFISIGSFENEVCAQACMKYIKTKFARVLLGVLKVTQHNPPRTWAKVPLQDFTSKSDIDWSQSISDIDQQLYEKYNLNDEEIQFIEDNVKEME